VALATKQGKGSKPKKSKLQFVVQNQDSDEDAQSDDESQFAKDFVILPAKAANKKDELIFSEPFRRIVYRHLIKLSVTEKGEEEYINAVIAYIDQKKGTSVRATEGLTIPIDEVNWVCSVLRDIGIELNKALMEGKTPLVTKGGGEVCRTTKPKQIWLSILTIELLALSNNEDEAVLRFTRVFDAPKKGAKYEKKADQMVELEVGKYYTPLCRALAELQAFEKTRRKSE
jgi:hypothetical protein